MTLRKVFFWLHLTAGVLAGVVILLMSVTGVLLAFERQIVAFSERDLRATNEQAARERLPLSQLVGAARGAGETSPSNIGQAPPSNIGQAPPSNVGEAQPSNVVVRSDRFAPRAVAFRTERTLLLNPYTAPVLCKGRRACPVSQAQQGLPPGWP